MNKTLILMVLLLCGALPLTAGNSIFSYDGFPVQYYGKDIYSLGMGDTGSSDVFRYNTGFGNPAMHSPTNRVLLATGLIMGWTSYRSQDADGTRYSFMDDSLDLPYFSLSIPIKRHRLGFQFNSFASGVVSNQRQFTLEDSTVVTEKQSMDKYLYRADLVYSVRLGSLNLGMSGNYYFGHDNRLFEQEANYGLFNTREELDRTFKNPNLTVGAIYSFPKFALGAYYSPPCILKGGEARTSIHEAEEEVDYEYRLPAHLAAGVTVLPFPEIKAALDFHFEPYSRLDDPSLGDSWKASLGLAYEPSAEAHQHAFMRIPARTGISLRRLPFQANNSDIDELGLSLGLSLPLKRDVNRLDLGFQYLKRGNLSQNQLADNSFLLLVGFTGFDILGKPYNRMTPREIPQKEEMEEW